MMEMKQILAIGYLVWTSGLILFVYNYAKYVDKSPCKWYEAIGCGLCLSVLVPMVLLLLYLVCGALWNVLMIALGVN